MTPEQRIAADLGLSLDDLRRLADDRRMQRLAPRMAQALRDLWREADSVLGSMPDDMPPSLSRAADAAEDVLSELDPPPLVKLGPGGDFTREVHQ